MDYQDRIYGNFNISDSVILEIINGRSLQRLKEISQIGYPKPYFSDMGHSRFEHSLGVYLLLRKYNASIEEQIAGLIHDVSHSAFSHCIDYALDAGSEVEHDHQDNVFEEFVRKSEIPEILNKFGFAVDYILNDENFPLKEKKLPDLCADRIDYSLRSALTFKVLSPAEINDLLDNLTASDNNWVFENLEFAEKYAKVFMKLNADYYSGLASAVMLKSVGDYLRYALGNGYITEADLYSTDEKVLAKIAPFHQKDAELKKLFDRMDGQVKFSNNPDSYDVQSVCKSRVVDPLFKAGKDIKRVSQTNEEWAKKLKEELNPKCYFIKFSE
ncbi:MAG: HD domain-containing protein [bacterium]|nr:HD domain-containing protein [bacterium]